MCIVIIPADVIVCCIMASKQLKLALFFKPLFKPLASVLCFLRMSAGY